MDLRPAFLYFHFPHDDPKKANADGRASLKQCGLLVDLQVARWASLFRCYEVDMSRSDRAAAERLGAGAGTSFAIVDPKLAVAAQAASFASEKATVQFLKDTLQKACPVYWEQIQKQIEEQRVALAEARKLADRKDWKAALEKYDVIRTSTLQVADFFDDAVAEAARAETKAKQKQ